MDEYIKKQDILQKIYSDAMWNRPFSVLYEDIVAMPAADVAPVVRCNDCAKDGLTTCPMCWIEKHTLNFVNHDPNFYCGYGERRNNG